MTRLAFLDLVPVTVGGSIAQSLANAADLAAHVESLGFSRYWVAEHHGMAGIASAATSVVLAHVGAATRRIRIGAGGIMLPNHAPLAIAEQFGTLATIHGDRIDLGLGRAPGGDGAVMHALRRSMQRNDDFPNDVVELLRYLGPAQPGNPVAAHPGQGTNVPVWILGSSLYGASLAAALGLPYAFASHFAPGDLDEALRLYRSRFQPTEFGDKPRFMLAVNVIAADTDAEAQRLRTSQQISFARLRLGTPGLLPPPVDDLLEAVPVRILPTVNAALAVSAIGAPDTVAAELDRLIARYQPDELILVGNIYDPEARMRSFAMAAEILRGRA